VSCWAPGRSRHRFLFWILSGIIQGCPCSGSLFAIAADFIIRALAAEITDDLWAFADDIAILIDSTHSVYPGLV
jgi:hypothetical protein